MIRGACRAVFVLLLIAVGASRAQACSPRQRDTPHSLIARADGIYLVRAVRYTSTPQDAEADRLSPLPTSTIQFQVLEVLKGARLGALVLPARVDGNDDFNDRPVPYDFVRPEGRHGNCYALSYGLGRQYLLFVKDGTPYWSALGPTNEQVRGADDPWVRWVRSASVEVAAHPDKYPPIRAPDPREPPPTPKAPTPSARGIDDSGFNDLLVHMQVVSESPLPHLLPDGAIHHYRILGYTQQGSCLPSCPASILYVATWNYTDHPDGDIRACRIDGLHFFSRVRIRAYQPAEDPFLTFDVVSTFALDAPRRYEVIVGTQGCSIRDAGAVARAR
jgi:hypothetical protein